MRELDYVKPRSPGSPALTRTVSPNSERMRKAIQYGKSLDEVAHIFKAGNNGAYANTWLLVDSKTSEIGKLELGLKNVIFSSSNDGYYFGANFPEDPKLIREETPSYRELSPAVKHGRIGGRRTWRRTGGKSMARWRKVTLQTVTTPKPKNRTARVAPFAARAVVVAPSTARSSPATPYPKCSSGLAWEFRTAPTSSSRTWARRMRRKHSCTT